MKSYSFFYKNGLSLVLIGMMLLFWCLQFITGWQVYNDELREYQQPVLSVIDYACSGHFASATFENWESEFLQMALYVLLTVKLRQKGSSESKKLKDEPGAENEDVDKEPKPKPGAPWPVIKGGFWLTIYKNSLSIAFGILFLASFWLHFEGSLKDYNSE